MASVPIEPSAMGWCPVRSLYMRPIYVVSVPRKVFMSYAPFTAIRIHKARPNRCDYQQSRYCLLIEFHCPPLLMTQK